MNAESVSMPIILGVALCLLAGCPKASGRPGPEKGVKSLVDRTSYAPYPYLMSRPLLRLGVRPCNPTNLEQGVGREIAGRC